jgi:hypothetical protein
MRNPLRAVHAQLTSIDIAFLASREVYPLQAEEDRAPSFYFNFLLSLIFFA